MPGGKCNVKIDSGKLRDAIISKGIKVSDAGKMCGYSSSGIQNAIDRGHMTKSMKVLIEKVLDIPFDEFKYVDPNQYETPVIEEVDDSQYQLLKRAAYDGVAEFCNKHLGPIIQNDILRALKEKEMEG